MQRYELLMKVDKGEAWLSLTGQEATGVSLENHRVVLNDRKLPERLQFASDTLAIC